mmetsp:Transcript_1400/g.1993  ORF Transcript_1400/g.1993 Transcript_1400/m.1993 type:complete len:166 (-) Transcript_1400:11-508(-)|eukprot:CAMPEP_0196588948 /NCGR_PEP_ID=MMETSP1081-20130531/62180_1 /TAXON_ID=36882 /ORGANISM="Pyramimonas amylifera, Strain CCMP720" /LENGTH=165 /DNA_ID=CAMNT_0041911601 /DNA_START=197 /DNA_END=694 /DNA_ORIENTATION=+
MAAFSLSWSRRRVGILALPLQRLTGVETIYRLLRTDTGGEAEDFIDRYLVKPHPEQPPNQGAILTTRREALSLYRSILRSSRLFIHKNERGDEWGDVLRVAARKEFEVGKSETDPEMAAKLVLTGRDYLEQALEKFMAKREKVLSQEEQNLVDSRIMKRSFDDDD